MSNIVSDIKIDSNKEFSQDVCLNVSTFFKGTIDIKGHVLKTVQF